MKAFWLSLLIAFGASARADLDLMKYIAFVEKWSSYEHKGEPLPQVEAIAPDLLQIFAYGELKVAQAEFYGKPLVPVLAAYERDSKTLYISPLIEVVFP